MVKVAIVYYSGYGHTVKVAEEINHFHLRDESLSIATRSRESS